jgi:subtilisin family serine protease
MSRKARRAAAAPRLETLETRALLSADPGRAIVGPWAATNPVNPSSAMLVRFAAGTTSAQEQADLDAVGARVVMSYPDGPSLVAVPSWESRDAALADLKADPGVIYAEADATFHASGVRASGGPVTPNNPYYPQQWGMTMIDAPSAWGVTTGTPGTIVAVLDTGLDLSNPAFAGRIWVNPDPSGRDGYRGDFYGWDFLNNTNNIRDDNGHGTHVTGILAAAGNNGYGVAGVDWGTRIMPLKVLDSQGNGSTAAAIASVYFAVNHGAKVLNASWGGDVFSQAMLDALNYANAAGAVFVTAAGNETSNNDTVTTYPASYRTPNELVVAAVDRNGNLADFSNWGPNTVDLAAPGVDIVSTVPGGFDTYSGTSMSTPFVSGAVALLAGANPGLNAAQLVARIRATAKPVPALKGLLISPGVVDPYFALLNFVPGSGGGTITTTSLPPLVRGATSLEGVEAAILTADSVYALDGGTPSGYVTGVYRALVARDPSSGELSYFTAALQSGVSRGTLVRALQNTPEARMTRVARWYRHELFATQPVSALKSDPGVVYWSNLLAAGWSDADVQAALVSNAGRYAALGGTAQQYASYLYPELLARAPAAAEVAYQAAKLNAGVSPSALARAFLASPEGHLTTIAHIYQDELGAAGTLSSMKSNPGVAAWAGYLGAD